MKESNGEKIKKQYEEVRKKYNLPSFKAIDSEFEIRKCNPDGFILREIRRSILSKVEALSHWFAPVIEPRPESIHTHVEISAFSKKDRHNLIGLFKKLTYLMHKGMSLDLDSTDKSEADFIKEVWKELPGLKKEISKVMTKITKTWSEPHKFEDQNADYMG